VTNLSSIPIRHVNLLQRGYHFAQYIHSPWERSISLMYQTLVLLKNLEIRCTLKTKCPKRANSLTLPEPRLANNANRLNCMNVRNFNCLGQYSKDYIRINLKRQFFNTERFCYFKFLLDKCRQQITTLLMIFGLQTYLNQLTSQLLGKISKIWLANFEPLIGWLFLSNFSPLASLVWQENEVTGGQTRHFCHKPYTKMAQTIMNIQNFLPHFAWKV